MDQFVCVRCRVAKDRAGFYGDRRRPHGLQSACRTCVGIRSKERSLLRRTGMFSIYMLSDPPTNLVRYVGCTGGSIATRLRQHISSSRADGPWPVSCWIRELREQGTHPQIHLISSVSKEEAGPEEDFWIDRCLAMGAKLLNQRRVDGSFFPETLEKLRIAQWRRWHGSRSGEVI